MKTNTLSKHGFNVQHFIDKFEDTAPEEWTTNQYHRHSEHLCDPDRYCALGFCGCEHYPFDTQEGDALRHIFQIAFDLYVDDVNDGMTSRFNDTHPRVRILTALYCLKARGW